MRRLHIAAGLSFLLFLQAAGQVDQTGLRAFTESAVFSSLALKYQKQTAAFYAANGYRYCWLNRAHPARLQCLLHLISSADSLGLQPDDYQPGVFAAYPSPGPVPPFGRDSAIAEVCFTDAAIHFMHDAMAGNQEEPLAFNGLQYTAGCTDIVQLLFSFYEKDNWQELPGCIEPKTAAYLAVKKLLNHFRIIAAAPGFRDAMVVSAKADTGNHALVQRLYQLGCGALDSMAVQPALLKAKLQEAQQMLSVLHDGVLRSTTLEVLNVPLARRIAALKSTLNALRWLECITERGQVIVVNIPSANLLLLEEGRVLLESRLIVGKKSTPTPTLTSSITEVVLYPYWNVPDKIARKELLPMIKRNTAYLSANNFQVLNLRGHVIDPSTINWKSMGQGNFPYRLRQSAGCDNSLGLIKLNFYSPFDVYLHDTPWKILFGFNKRYFSHGCMRLQKAKEVARYVLGSNTIAVDTVSEEKCLTSPAPVTVPAAKAIPVVVLYHTAWTDAAANVRFYEDAYDKQWMQKVPVAR